jgi:hypothetical protein
MISMRTTLLTIALLTASLQHHLVAQAPGSLIGTWKLVSATTTAADGKTNTAPYGSNPTGFLTYSPDGRMTAIISNGGRKALSIADRITAPADERAQAFATFLAYAGTYTVQGGKVTHHIEAASIQNWVSGDQVRLFKLDGDHLTVLTPPDYLFNGQPQTFELKWERVK